MHARTHTHTHTHTLTHIHIHSHSHTHTHSHTHMMQSPLDATPDLLKTAVYSTEPTELPSTSQLQTIEVH